MNDLITIPLAGSEGVPEQAGYGADGNTLESMNLSGVLHLWRAPLWSEIEAAEAHEKRGPQR